MADYILRGVDPDLWDHFKARCEDEGRSMRWVLIQLLTHYLKHGLPRPR